MQLSSEAGSVNVLIVEPQTIFTPHLAFLATMAGAVHIGIASAPDEALAPSEYRLILLDPDYADVDPLESVRLLASAAPRAAICVLTGEHEPGRSSILQRAGATSVVSKNASDAELVQALRLSLEHRAYTDARVDAA